MQITNENGVTLLYSDTSRFGSLASQTVVSKAHAPGQTIDQASFTNIRFESGNFDSTRFVDSTFGASELEGTWVPDAVFEECFFSDVLFYEVQAFRCKWVGGTLQDVRFEGANLAEANFNRTTMQNVIFAKDQLGLSSDLRGADLSKVDLSAVSFVSAVFDRKTRFPSDFVADGHAGLQRMVDETP